MRPSWKLGSRLKRTLRNLLFTSVMTLAGGIVLGILFNPVTAVVSVAVVAAHEGGHYYSALMREADPEVPVVLPLGISTLGVTKINSYHNLSARAKRYLLWCGPLAGVAATIAMVPGAFFIAGLGVVLSVVAASELMNITIGSDGQKRRQLQGG